MNIIESKLFMVHTNTALYPVFYVTADDILSATKTAKTITDEINKDKVIGRVSVVEIPLLSLGESDD